MKVYHGTIAEFAEDIKKTGLLPLEKNKFRLAFKDQLAEAFGLDMDSHNTYTEEPTQVHVTPDLEHAKRYAKFRARYENARPGERVEALMPWYNPPEKTASTPRVQDDRPVVVEVELPGYWRERFAEDDGDHTGMVTDYPIPPEYITKIIPVNA